MSARPRARSRARALLPDHADDEGEDGIGLCGEGGDTDEENDGLLKGRSEA